MKKQAIILHLFYKDLWSEFKEKLIPILDTGDVDLYVSIQECDESILPELENYAKKCFVLPNKGLDIGPLVYVLDYIKELEYSTITKIHTKKSLHHGQPAEFGEKWRKTLTECLIGNPEIFKESIKEIESNELILIGSKEYYFNFESDKYNIPHHYSVIKDTLNLLQINITETLITSDIQSVKFGEGNFIAGSMFMTSHNYLKKLFSNVDLLKLYSEFPENYHRNSIAHALERIFGFYIEDIGGIVLKK